MPAAAHVGTPITHSSAMGGLLAGVLIGAAIGAAVVATGGAAAIVIAGAAATGASLGGMAGKFLGGMSTSVEGAITTGSPNVFIHRKPAAFCSSLATCAQHPGPAMVAQGSSTVGINGRPAARTGDKGVCAFEIGEGSPRVNIGGAPSACADVGSEVPWYADAALLVLGLAGGGVALAARGMGAAAISARLGGSLVGGYGGSMGGSYAGGRIFGEGSTGQSIMAFGGGLVGGGLGYGAGARTVPFRPPARAPTYTYNMVENPGPLASVRNNPAANFAGGKYNATTLTDDVVLYRGGEAGKPLGQWFTREPPGSVANVRIDSAVKPQWIDPGTGALTGSSPINAVHAVRIPKGTVIYEGPVGYQGGPYLGGQNQMQIFVQEPWKIPGVTPVSSTPLR
jgi:uncharacterized Zn-binding protein involved in type VI secretion